MSEVPKEEGDGDRIIKEMTHLQVDQAAEILYEALNRDDYFIEYSKPYSQEKEETRKKELIWYYKKTIRKFFFISQIQNLDKLREEYGFLLIETKK